MKPPAHIALKTKGEQKDKEKIQQKKKSRHKKIILGNKLDYLQGKTVPGARLTLIWGA